MKDPRAIARHHDAPASEASARRIGFAGDDAVLVRALLSGHPGAPAELFDRYGAHVERVLAAVLGVDDELPDLLHEVFARALADVGALDQPDRLRAWLTSIAVHTARGCIRRRRRGRWLRFWAPEELPEFRAPASEATLEAREALAAIYRILRELPEPERIAFSLRFIGGLELVDVAAACRTSLSSLKRRLARAEGRFMELARRDPALAERLGEGSRWRSP
jgi:RNA polymerase sigma-70 factor, ECF subfamily